MTDTTPPKVVVCDIGAAMLDDLPPYMNMDLETIDLYKFDGDTAAKGDHDLSWISNGETATVQYAQPSTGMTSLYPPNHRTQKLFDNFEHLGRVIHTRKEKTTRLDDIEDLPPVDFLVMDTQGSELDIMKHGALKLASCVVVQLEVSFVPLYLGQPTLGTVDTFMRHRGFIPHTFVRLKPWPVGANGEKHGGFTNQLLEADMVYVKDPRSGNWTSEQRRKAAEILTQCYESRDLAHYIANGGT